MRILGIDPGYAIVGYGLLDYDKTRFATVSYGAIMTSANLPFQQRLLEIYNDLNELIRVYTPELIAVERLFFTTNQKTAMDVAHARGVILLAAVRGGVEIAEYTPLQVKQAVSGYGKATKSQVQEMTKRILNLSAIPKPDDTADALAIAICCAHTHTSRRKFQ
jgi:crossover junction endodeoxyribonuclease RuvC